jgi:RNA polymerase sigma-70 factor (ECF subfamily)
MNSYFADVMRGQHAHLMVCARRLTRNDDDARDLVQDTYVHALEALEGTSVYPDNMRGWLVVVMRNRWFNIVRNHKTRRLVHAELSTRPSFDDGLHETRAVHGQFARAWGKLPAQSQSIAQQCLLDGDSQQAVSLRFGMTAGGVATVIHRMRESLRASMFGDGSTT